MNRLIPNVQQNNFLVSISPSCDCYISILKRPYSSECLQSIEVTHTTFLAVSANVWQRGTPLHTTTIPPTKLFITIDQYEEVLK